MYYIECKNCGAHLDPGEQCDCAEKKNAAETQSATATNERINTTLTSN